MRQGEAGRRGRSEALVAALPLGRSSKNWPPAMWKYHFRTGVRRGDTCARREGTVLTNGSFHVEWRAATPSPPAHFCYHSQVCRCDACAARAGQQVTGWGRPGSAPGTGRGPKPPLANPHPSLLHDPPIASFLVYRRT